MKFRAILSIACLVAVAGCGSDDDNVRTDTLTPGVVRHGTMTPAAPVESTADSGPLSVVAVADAGWVFAGWVATPADNAVFEDAALDSTGVVLSGDATIAATFILENADYFVNPRLGSDDAAGTSPSQAFRTLTHALAIAGAPGKVAAAIAGKAAGPVVALAPGHYDAANGEVFPIVVPQYATVIGDEENRGEGITIEGSGPMPSWTAIPVGVIPSSYAALRGLHFQASGRYTLAYDFPSGGTSITLSRNTIEAGSDGGLYLQVAEWGTIQDNVWTAGQMTLVAVGGAANTAVRDNIFHGPIELDDNHLDLGGGAGSSPGNNQIIGNGMSYFGGPGIKAQNNHWRHSPPTVSPNFAYGASEYDMYLQGENTTVDTTGYW